MRKCYAFALLALCLVSGVYGQVRLQGSIYNPLTRQPIPQVNIGILASTIETISDKDGHFEFPALEKGVYYLYFQREGYAPIIRDVEIGEEAGIFSIGISLIPIQSEIAISSVNAPQLVDRTPIHVPHAVGVYELWRAKDETPSNLPAALQSITGLSSYELFHGGSALYLRGLSGSRLPIYLDGMPLLQANNDHISTKNLLTIDPLSIQRTEVLRGTGSAQFGSDALSGLLSMTTHKVDFSQEGWQVHGNLTGRVGFNGNNSGEGPQIYEGGGRAEFSISGPKLALSLGGSSYGNNNLPTGFQGTPLDSTAYGRQFRDMNLRIALGKKHELRLIHQGGDVRNLNLALGNERTNQVRGKIDQLSRSSTQAQYISYSDNKFRKKVEVSLGLQDWSEDITYRGPGGTWNYEDAVRGVNSRLNVTSSPIPYWTFVSGLSYSQERYESVESTFRENGNGQENIRGRIPENSAAGDLSLFTSHSIDVLKLRLSLGGRAHFYSRNLDQQSLPTRVLVGNFSGMYPLAPNYKLYFSSQTGYRAPNLFDYGYQAPNYLGFVSPNDSIVGERTISSEVGLKAATQNFNGSLAFYRTQFTDFLDWRPSRFNGATIYQGLPVYSLESTGQAYIQGVEAEMEVIVNSSIIVFGNIAYTYARNISQAQALSNIPPLNGRFGLRYQNRRGIWSRLEWRYADAQSRLGFVDLPNPRVMDPLTAGWNVIDFHIGWKYKLGYVNLGVQNLLNTSYYVHGAGVPGTGRMILLSSQLGF
ncbi:MAG: TonB-dependent receptor [Bacteroidota bacterium]